MKLFPSMLAAMLVVSAALTFSLRATTQASEFSPTASGDIFPNKSIIIYVADFDIDALRTREEKNSAAPIAVPAATDGSAPVSPATPAASQSPAEIPKAATRPDVKKSDGEKVDGPRADSQRSAPQKSDAQKDDSPAGQAARLVDLTSTTLVKALEQAGYTARKLRSSAAHPDGGVVLHGVFAQADENAGLRRMVVGGDSTDTKMLLFVGVGNLARPDQPVYLPVGPATADGRLGPVISVSVYAPVSRYDLDRDPSEELLKKTSARIVSDMTKLLNANPLAVNQ